MSVHSAPGEQNLRYWLANEDWYPSKFTRDFLARTPEAEANDALEEIAHDADLEKLSFWGLFTIMFAMAGFTMSFGLAGPSLEDRKAGIRAALLLAERGDARALVPLARIWSRDGLLASKYQDLIEKRLIALLHDASEDQPAPRATEVLTELLQRVWNARPLSRDLTADQADLLLALLHYLQISHSAPPEAIRSLTDAPARGENRLVVQEAVHSQLSKMSLPP